MAASGGIAVAIGKFSVSHFEKIISTQKDVVTQKYENQMTEKIDSLLEGNKSLQEKIQPFEEFAKKKYPGIEIDAALDQLSQEMQRSEQKILENQNMLKREILEQGKKTETTLSKKMEILEDKIEELQKNKGKELEVQFPGGYQLFGIIDKEIVHSGKSSFKEIKIDWSTAKILNVTKDFVDIMFPSTVLPVDNVLKDNVMRMKNEKGARAVLFRYGNLSNYAEILKSDENGIIAIIGYQYKP